jgi:hypothetical protein
LAVSFCERLQLWHRFVVAGPCKNKHHV